MFCPKDIGSFKYGSSNCSPFTYTVSFFISTISPGIPIIRFTNTWLSSSGNLKTIISRLCGSSKRYEILNPKYLSPVIIVFSIELVGVSALTITHLVSTNAMRIAALKILI